MVVKRFQFLQGKGCVWLFNTSSSPVFSRFRFLGPRVTEVSDIFKSLIIEIVVLKS